MVLIDQRQEAQAPRRLYITLVGHAIQTSTGVMGMLRCLSQGEDWCEAGISAFQLSSPIAA